MAYEASFGLLYTEPDVGMGLHKIFIMPSLSVLASPKRLPAMLRLCSFMVGYVEEECYLVDPASSHMLVSKIKPCMCKYEQIQTVKLRMAH